jgi:hypothetical protein
MSSTAVNPQVIDAINQSQTAAMGAQVVLTSGAGKAYQSVAQSTAIAIQDATDALRNISTITTTAAGVVIAQMLVNPATPTSALLPTLQQVMEGAIADYTKIGVAAAGILEEYPSG